MWGAKERVLKGGLVKLRRGDFRSIVDLPVFGAFRLAGWLMGSEATSIRTHKRSLYTRSLRHELSLPLWVDGNCMDTCTVNSQDASVKGGPANTHDIFCLG